MNSKLMFLTLITLLLLIAPASAVRTEVEETAQYNKTSGSWDQHQLYLNDGNWATFTNCTTGSCYYYFNYSTNGKEGAIRASSYLTVKEGNASVGGSLDNSTALTVASACWGGDLLNFTLSIAVSQLNAIVANVSWNCTTPTGTETNLRLFISSDISVYEEQFTFAYESPIKDVLKEFGDGTGQFFNSTATPLGKFLMIIVFVMAIGAILSAVAYIIITKIQSK